MKKVAKGFGIFVVILGIIYWLGPAPSKPNFKQQLPTVPSTLSALEQTIQMEESKLGVVKPNNQARIVWADPTRKAKTPYSILYLHGFSASQEEGAPVHTDIARRFGCNLYLARLEDHGTDHADVFLNLTAEKMVASAQRALTIAEQLGDSVIVMGTSNGGALGLYLAATQPRISSLILYSPAVAIYSSAALLLDKPWGLQIARQVYGSDYALNTQANDSIKRYWSTRYRLEGLVALQSLLSNTMTEETFRKITCPVFLGYYYKNEEEQDKVVSVPAMLQMFDQLSTPPARKRKVNFPNAKEHVIASHVRTQEWPAVERETARFLEEVVRLQPVTQKAIAVSH